MASENERGLQLESQSSKAKSLVNFLVRAAVSAVLLWLPLRHVPLGSLASEMRAFQVQAIVGGLLVLCASTFIAALRWSLVLSALKNPRGLAVTYPLSLIGIFFGQALPSGIGGDVVRVWLARKTGLTTRIAFSSVLADRVAGFLAILIIVTVELPPLHDLFRSSALFDGLLVVLIGGYSGLTALMVLDKLPAALHRFRVVRGSAAVSSDLRAAILCPLGILVLSCGAAIQLLNVLAVALLAAGLQLPVTFFTCLLIVPFANVLQTIPVSIAGWGVRESFFVAAFALVGVAASSALAISVAFGLLFLASSLPGGALWFLQGTGSPLKAREAIEP